ncbi:LysR family transcriptional regulator [Francisellaceae bacterium]|nr:LysR family transcriptional regulator [Francisellaceae bacterium]
MLATTFTIKQIETFYFSAKYLNITKAAKVLNISTPAAWKHIQNLEGICNEKLFQKDGKHIKLTYTGQMLCNEAAIFLSARQNLANAILDITNSEQQPIKLSMNNTFQRIGFQLIKPFIKSFPNIKIEFTIDRWIDQVKLINDKTYDFFLISDPFSIDPNLIQTKLFDFEHVLVASSENAITNCTKISPEDISHFTHLTTHVKSITQSKHSKLYKQWCMKKSPIIVDSFMAKKEAILANLGIGILPKCIIEDEIRDRRLIVLPIETNLISSEFIILYKSSSLQKGSHEAFFNFCTANKNTSLN